MINKIDDYPLGWDFETVLIMNITLSCHKFIRTSLILVILIDCYPVKQIKSLKLFLSKSREFASKS